jgi:hypothetical protein
MILNKLLGTDLMRPIQVGTGEEKKTADQFFFLAPCQANQNHFISRTKLIGRSQLKRDKFSRRKSDRKKIPPI